MPTGCFPLMLFIALLFYVPVFFADLMLLAMGKLGFTPGFSLWLVIGIFIGGMINIPVKRIERNETVDMDPFMYLGLHRVFHRIHPRSYTLIAVNVGGCLIPSLIVVYELMIVSRLGFHALALTLLSTAINIFLCYQFARPIPRLGIALPAWVPAFAAVLCAWIFLPEIAPPVAFVAGVLGPLIGADLLHLKDISAINTGMGSIGGAGTFDGIVLSGLFATLLA